MIRMFWYNKQDDDTETSKTAEIIKEDIPQNTSKNKSPKALSGEEKIQLEKSQFGFTLSRMESQV